MSFAITYGLLFEVTLFHNYFLNDGEKTFQSMAPAVQEKMLQQFNIDSFASIKPTLETNMILRNYKMVFKRTKTGFRIYIKVKELAETDPYVKVPDDLKLNFLITVSDYQFENYTNLDFFPNQIFLFSNVKPSTEPVSFKYLPKIDDNKLISNAYLVSEKTSSDLISALQPSEKQDVFGLISLTSQGDDPSGNLINAGKIISPNFKIHFDNRKTFWRYINQKTGTIIKTNAVKPLAHYGFVVLDPVTDLSPSQPVNTQYPNPSVKSITKISGDYYSEIFI